LTIYLSDQPQTNRSPGRGPALVSCTLRAASGRLFVRWTAPDDHLWRAIFRDFRAQPNFPTHRDAYAIARGLGWSLPAHHRARLEAWVRLWFDPAQVQGSLDEDPPDDTLAGLQRRRHDAVLALRSLPDRGPICRALKRQIARLDEDIGAVIERGRQLHEEGETDGAE
jgi:hypothetical protein